jgi:site-specific DNA recombinase
MKGASVVSLPRRLRCAIYTRKSSEEGLDMEFNSLDAQRDACAAYTASQKAEGWVALRDSYDDGGFSGGTLERPALKRLLADIEAGLIDVVVVYKIDRLSRSLMDFARLVEVFDRNNVTFVSVTQSFNTTTSMGRLTLNILLSFAQFEREVIGERIRDKVAASRKRGMWMGGVVPIGYDVVDRKLVINETEAALVRQIFERFVLLGSVTLLVRELQAERRLTKRGKPFDKGIVYKLINNRVYVGDAVHKGTAYPGEHAPLIERGLFDKVQAILSTNSRARAAVTRTATPALLRGLIFCEKGRALTPAYSKKRTRLYRYYVSTDAIRGREAIEARPLRLSADTAETAVLGEIRRLLRAPEVVAQAIAAVKKAAPSVTQSEIVAAIGGFEQVWAALFPAEQARIVRLLVERVTVTNEGLAVDLRTEGLGAVVREMITPTHKGATE